MADKILLLVLGLALCAAAMGQRQPYRPLIGGSEASLDTKNSTSSPNPVTGPPPGSDSDSLPPNVRKTRSNPVTPPPNPHPGSVSGSPPPNLPIGGNPLSLPPSGNLGG